MVPPKSLEGAEDQTGKRVLNKEERGEGPNQPLKKKDETKKAGKKKASGDFHNPQKTTD